MRAASPRADDPPHIAPAIDPPIEALDSGTVLFVASFRDFYRLHYGQLLAALTLNLGDPDMGREAADEAMTRAYQRWGTVSSLANPAGWVYRVGLNWSNSQFRRAKRRLPWHTPSTVEMPATSDPALMDALQSLNHRLRSVVVCRYYLDWSIQQTATALEIAPGTVKSRLHTALGILRTELDEPTNGTPQQRMHK